MPRGPRNGENVNRSDAITSAAAFIGIALAIWGGPGREPADDWAALVASVIIAANGFRFTTTAASELMDRSPDNSVIAMVDTAARSVAGVLATEKVRARQFGVAYLVDLHVQADQKPTLEAAHVVSGKVKTAIREALPAAQEVLVHMEPI